jgi:hypothetical protein
MRAIKAMLALWVLDAVLFYLSTPLTAWFSLIFTLCAALVHLAVIVTGLVLVIYPLTKRAWLGATAVALVGVTCGLMVHAVDWERAFIRHQVAWHRSALQDLAASYNAGSAKDGTGVPSSLGLLSSDDVVHVWSDDRGDPPVLFLQTWQDWRAESGTGLAYFRSPPDAAIWVRTAEGDGGHPVRDMGDGWWWIE